MQPYQIALGNSNPANEAGTNMVYAIQGCANHVIAVDDTKRRRIAINRGKTIASIHPNAWTTNPTRTNLIRLLTVEWIPLGA